MNYRFGADENAGKGTASWFPLADDSFNVHGQTTFAWLAYPAFRSPYTGPQSLPGGGQGAETFDATLYAGNINQFADTLTANRLVLTVGRMFVTDIFDTNKYANSSKTDFMNWSFLNATTFDFAGDAWELTYGAVAEWYQNFWTLRAGVFDLSATPEGGTSPTAIKAIELSTNSRSSAKSRSAISSGASPASSRSPAFSAAAGQEHSRTLLSCPAHRAARRHQCGAHLHQPSRREHQPRAAGVRIGRRVRPCGLG